MHEALPAQLTATGATDILVSLLYSDRPKTRGDCYNGPRPCPWVSCRHHLYLEVNDEGVMKVSWPEHDPWEIPETCSLDVADRGTHTLEDVGRLLNKTRERIRQLEVQSLFTLMARGNPEDD